MTMNYPHTALFLGENRTVTITGPYVHVLDTQSGAVLKSTAAATGSENDMSPKKVEPIRCAAVSRGLEYLATTGDDKILRVWDLEKLVELSALELPKKPTSLYITKDANTIVVADKFGDVFSYPLIPPPVDEEKKTENQQHGPLSNTDDKAPQKPKLRGTLTSHENPSNGTLILGHTSMLNAMIFSDDERYIFTADRDEHIRVSHYPHGWDIERYCLGHKKYVSAIHVPSFDSSSSLVSGGGDSMVKIWDWMQGKVVREIEGVEEAVKPFIKVRAKRKQRLVWNIDDGEVEGENAGGEGFKQGGKRGRRAKKRVAKAKALAKLAEEEERTLEKADKEKEEEVGKEDIEDAGNDSAENDEQEAMDAIHAELATDSASDNDLVLVINRIDSFRSSEGAPYIVFCAVGATALFIAPYAGSSPTDNIPNSRITSFNLKQPVLDFVIGPSNFFWVSTDPNYDLHPDAKRPLSIRLLHWTGSWLEEVTDAPSLLAGLNNYCNVPATAKDLKTLDLYADLNSMPKYHDASSGGGGDGDDGDEVEVDEREGTPGANNHKPATKRMLGRLKNKRALEQLTSSTAGAAVTIASSPREGAEDRGMKRLKEDLVEQQDAEML